MLDLLAAIGWFLIVPSIPILALTLLLFIFMQYVHAALVSSVLCLIVSFIMMHNLSKMTNVPPGIAMMIMSFMTSSAFQLIASTGYLIYKAL